MECFCCFFLLPSYFIPSLPQSRMLVMQAFCLLFRNILQIFHGRQIHVCCSVCGLICENCRDNFLKTRTWFLDYRSVSSWSLCSRKKSFMLLTGPFLHNYATSGWRGLQDHQRATSMCPLTPRQPPAVELDNKNMASLLNIKD